MCKNGGGVGEWLEDWCTVLVIDRYKLEQTLSSLFCKATLGKPFAARLSCDLLFIKLWATEKVFQNIKMAKLLPQALKDAVL